MITPEEAIANVERRVAELRLAHANKEMGDLPVSDRADQIHCLFEGLCPTCGREVTLIRVGGVQRFLEEMVFMGEHEYTVWEYPQSGDSGCIDFKCKNDHEHHIGYSFASGDWH